MPTASPTGCLTDRDQLLAILSRAVTLANGYHSPFVDDDLRMLRDVGATFVGRAAYVWVTKPDDEQHFSRARQWASRVHDEVSDEVVLQAGIFEAIYPQVDDIPMPAWVFEDLGEAAESRNFSYEAMLGRVVPPAQGLGTPWEGGGVPDLATDEAFRWFYYRARRYLECGYEALHIGQAHLVAGADRGYQRLQRLCALIRKAASKRGRRGWVILDAHSHGIAIDGQLLFDFASRPFSARGLLDHPPHMALIKRGESIGGVHPGGWTCEHAPTLVEVDNWGGYSMHRDDEAWNDLHRRGRAGFWGYDQIAWLARLDAEQRAAFLRYAHNWTRLQGDTWFLQMPLARSLGRADLKRPDGSTQHRYRANRPGDACPEGFGDEDAIVDIWQQTDPGRHRDPAPAPPAPTPSGLTVPEPVTVVGPLQPLLGGVPGDASCPWSRLWHVGDGRFARTFALPLAGRFTFFITAGGTQTDPTKQGGVAGGKPFTIDVPAPGTMVRISFDYEARTVEAMNVETGASMRCE